MKKEREEEVNKREEQELEKSKEDLGNYQSGELGFN